MIRIITLNQAKSKLFQNEVLVYKPLNQKVVYLSLKNENRITKFNENFRYNISFEELEDILEHNKVYLFEKEKEIEINQDFKKLIQ